MSEFQQNWRSIRLPLQGKQIATVEATPFCTGLDGAAEEVTIIFTDATKLVLRAGSYIIPEESCIYAELKP